MIINPTIENLLNFRIEQEEMSARLYISMSKWLTYNGLFGAASLWEMYAKEELKHAQWACKFLEDLGNLPKVPALGAPVCDFKGLCEIVELSLAHEELITKQCNELAKASLEAGDFNTFQLAQKYNNEQVEEIAKMTYWSDRIEQFGESEIALRMLDEEMKNKV